MSKIKLKEVQVHEMYDDFGQVDQVTISGIKFKNMRSHGYQRIKDKKTGKYFWRFIIDCRTKGGIK